jgi:hypothetical protein
MQLQQRTHVDVNAIDAMSLPELVKRANRAHEQGYAYAKKSVEAAILTGRLLLEAKARVGHGKWQQFFKENYHFSARSAQGYMRLCRINPDASLAHLGIEGLLRRFAEAKTDPMHLTVTTVEGPQESVQPHVVYVDAPARPVLSVVASPSGQRRRWLNEQEDNAHALMRQIHEAVRLLSRAGAKASRTASRPIAEIRKLAYLVRPSANFGFATSSIGRSSCP